MRLFEAATNRAKARAAAKALKALLADKTLPATLRKQAENLHAAMGKTWADLEKDAETDPEPKEALRERANAGNYLEARLHAMVTGMIDEQFAQGYVTRAERAVLMSAVEGAMETFALAVENEAPDLLKRRPWMEAPDPEEPAQVVEADASDIESDFVPLVEKAVRTDGTIPLKIIQPGWGSSGYYPAEVLERDGPQVFKSGLKMFWNHQTPTEEAQRPEGDLRDLAAELVSDARYQADHPAGPGLYADAKVFEGYQPAVDDLAPHIGVSIRARGRAVAGQAEGKTGPIIQEISAAKSVDFVTSPGAGGQILQLFEARRGAAQVQSRGDDMDEKELQALKEANAQLEKTVADQAANLARISEALVLREAGDFVAVELASSGLPDITKARLLRDLAHNPPVKEGKLDQDVYRTQIAEAVKAERAYLAEVAGAGRITGMGGTTQTATNDEASRKSLVEAFMRTGLSKDQAEIAAAGR